MSFCSELCHSNVGEKPQELSSCFYQLACDKVGGAVGHISSSCRSTLLVLSEELTLLNLGLPGVFEVATLPFPLKGPQKLQRPLSPLFTST